MKFRFFELTISAKEGGKSFKKLRGVLIGKAKNTYFDVKFTEDAKAQFTIAKGTMKYPLCCDTSELTSDKYFITEKENNGYTNLTIVIKSLDGVHIEKDDYQSKTLESFDTSDDDELNDLPL